MFLIPQHAYSRRKFTGTAVLFFQVACVLVLMAVFQSRSANAQNVTEVEPNGHVYPGETLANAAGHQVLYKFIPGDKDKPMMVFVPGDAHLGRIFYGYPGGRAEDFIAHWVTEQGHPFLAVSYPMSNSVFTEAVPGYDITDWGDQVAAVIAHVRNKHDLNAPVIVAGWSMGGKIASSVGRAAKANGTEIVMFVAMSADPPVPGFLPAANAKAITLDKDGYADRTSIYDWFLNAISEQSSYNGHTILPEDIYTSQFLGAVPIDLIDTGTLYQNGKLVKDLAKAIETSGMMAFEDFPLPVVIHDNSVSDFENVLQDASDWAYVRNRVLIRKYMSGLNPSDLSDSDWQQARLLMSLSQAYLTEVVQGNHFFFIGEIGARNSVEKIITLHSKIESLPLAARPK